MRTSIANADEFQALASPEHPCRRLRSPQRREWMALFAVLTAAFLAYSVAWPQAPINTLDTPSYMRLASDIKQFRLTELHQRTPGYPLLIALTGSDRQLTRSLFYITLIMQLLSVAFCAGLLYACHIHKAIAAAFVFVALLPPFVESSAYATTETASQFAVNASALAVLLWSITRRRAAFVAFVLAAVFAALVRPTFEALIPMLAVCLIGLRALGCLAWIRLRRLTVAMAGATSVVVLLFAALALLNYKVFGYFEATKMSAYAASHKVAHLLEFLPPEYDDIKDIAIKHRDRLLVEPFRNHDGYDYIYPARLELLAVFGGDEVRMLRRLNEASAYLIRAKPMSYLHENLMLLGSFWMPNDYELANGRSPVLRACWALLQLLIVGLLILQAFVVVGFGLLAATVRMLGRRLVIGEIAPEPMIVAYTIGMAIILYTMVVSCFAGIGENRYRIPIDLLIMTTSIIGVTIWRRALVVLSTGSR